MVLLEDIMIELTTKKLHENRSKLINCCRRVKLDDFLFFYSFVYSFYFVILYVYCCVYFVCKLIQPTGCHTNKTIIIIRPIYSALILTQAIYPVTLILSLTIVREYVLRDFLRF